MSTLVEASSEASFDPSELILNPKINLSMAGTGGSDATLSTPAEDKSLGFARSEMFGKKLHGENDVPKLHLFVVFGTAESWEPRLEEVEGSPMRGFKEAIKCSEAVLAAKGKGYKVTLTAIEGISGKDAPGDVLVFPQRVRVSEGDQRLVEIVEAAATAANDEDLSKIIPGASQLPKGGLVFVCSHTSRDARCGHCGPRMIKSFRSASAEAVAANVDDESNAVQVRGCSHVGGHIYAGNAIVVQNDGTCDWLGYLTDSVEDSEYVIDLAQSRIAVPNPLNWRGRSGLSKDEHKLACAACGNGDIEDLVAAVTPKSKPRVLFVLGGPGSGKGTQCAILADKFDVVHLSAGDLLREERSKPNSADGALIDRCIAEGSIVPVEITVRLLLAAIKASTCDTFLIDGFPRNHDNLDGWKRVIKNEVKVLGVLFFDCPQDVMQSRLLERGKTSGRTDDNNESIRKRFVTFTNDTMPVVSLFQKRGKCFSIAADRAKQDIASEAAAVFAAKTGLVPLAERPNVLFVLGGPGSGKGTQCDKILENFAGFEHLSAGELLRAERRDPQSSHGLIIESCIKNAKIVPVEITVSLLLKAMQGSSQSNFLVDGFPRNADNVSGWDNVVGAKANVLGCLFFDCPESVMEQRLLARAETSGRLDDNIETIRKRFKGHLQDTMPIVQSYRVANKCFTVESDRPVDKVFEQVEQVLETRLGFKSKRRAVGASLSPVHKLVIGTAGAAFVLLLGYRFMPRTASSDK